MLILKAATSDCTIFKHIRSIVSASAEDVIAANIISPENSTS